MHSTKMGCIITKVSLSLSFFLFCFKLLLGLQPPASWQSEHSESNKVAKEQQGALWDRATKEPWEEADRASCWKQEDTGTHCRQIHAPNCQSESSPSDTRHCTAADTPTAPATADTLYWKQWPHSKYQSPSRDETLPREPKTRLQAMPPQSQRNASHKNRRNSPK